MEIVATHYFTSFLTCATATMIHGFGEFLPTLILMILLSFVLGNTVLVRFGRRLLPPVAVCILAVRLVFHYIDLNGEEQIEKVSVYATVTQAISLVLSKLKSKVLALFLADIIGVLMGFAALKLIENVALFRFASAKKSFIDEVYGIARHIPSVKHMLQQEEKKMEDSFEKDLKVKSREIGVKYGVDGQSSYKTLPSKVYKSVHNYFPL